MQTKGQILIVDDEEQMRRAMETVLARMGHSVRTLSNGQEALELIKESSFDMIISDIKMPVMDGLQLLASLRRTNPELPVVMITAYGTIAQAVEVMKNGAYDFITKPFSAEDLEGVVKRIFSTPQSASLQKKEGKASGASGVAMVSKDPSFKRVLEVASAVANSTASILVQGESGTGKELISRFVHAASNRALQPFVAVNCAALPNSLLESELFGHEKGSFTGAIGTKIGKFEQANGGTILLDEISEMEQGLQAKLLRVLQEREVDRVGGAKPIQLDVRVIATTNRDIRECVREGSFREDLYYRLNVIPLYIPALRERTGDISLLIEHFVRKYSQGRSIEVDPGLIEKLEEYSWPGNVRELQNACERALLLANHQELQLEHFLLGTLTTNDSSKSVDELTLQAGMSVAEAERRLIFETLRSTNNNRTKAAEMLGISIRTLRNKLNEYGEVLGS